MQRYIDTLYGGRLIGRTGFCRDMLDKNIRAAGGGYAQGIAAESPVDARRAAMRPNPFFLFLFDWR
jgi:hypothetical protein